MKEAVLADAIARVPPGRWAVGVSGGADSVALLALLRERADLQLHIAHLDHQTRAGASAEDAAFVQALAKSWGLPTTVCTRSEIEKQMKHLPANLPARYRAARMEMFRRVVESEQLLGVILAHHWDDQAETIMQRLLRGSGTAGLRGMSGRASIGGLTVLRPLLGVRCAALRRLLVERGISWREDASNSSPGQQRNRVRKVLRDRPELSDCVVKIGRTCAQWERWLLSAAPELDDSFAVSALQNVPDPVANRAASRWLQERAGAAHEISPAAARRLVQMARDAASPARQEFPGGITVRRRGGRIFRG